MSDDSDSVIQEVFEAVSAALNELHLSMKPFGDPIILGKSPHASNRFDPGLECLGKGKQWNKEASLEALDDAV